MRDEGVLVLLRHGESTFNASSTFTGLLDVGLTPGGEAQVVIAARLLIAAGLVPDLVVTTPMLRARRTASILLADLAELTGRADPHPIRPTWRLVERDYGCLTGLSKAVARARYGEEAFFTWRRTLHGRPPAASPEQVASWTDPAPVADSGPLRPGCGESLADVIERVRPLWDELRPTLASGVTVFVVAHGNSLRALCAIIDDLDDHETEELNIPAGHPLVYQVTATGDVHPRGGFYLDDTAAQREAAKVAAEGGT